MIIHNFWKGMADTSQDAEYMETGPHKAVEHITEKPLLRRPLGPTFCSHRHFSSLAAAEIVNKILAPKGASLLLFSDWANLGCQEPQEALAAGAGGKCLDTNDPPCFDECVVPAAGSKKNGSA